MGGRLGAGDVFTPTQSPPLCGEFGVSFPVISYACTGTQMLTTGTDLCSTESGGTETLLTLASVEFLVKCVVET